MRDQSPVDPTIWVDGEGPRPATYMVVSDGPGEEELRHGRPFAGPSGKIHAAFLRLTSGLERHETYSTHFSKLMLTDQQHKKGLADEELETWGSLLDAEVAEVAPSFVLALGKHSASHFLGHAARMETVHGIPHAMAEGRIVVPAFHPGAGLKDSKRLGFTYADYEAFGAVCQGRQGVWKPKAGGSKYRLAVNADLLSGRAWTEVSIDTEFEGDEPLMLTFTAVDGTGYAILADNVLMLRLLRWRLAKDRPAIIFHNALADLVMLKRLGIDIAAMKLRIRDTMVLAWYRETEPQGLKALAYRHLGVDRSGFEGIVAPYFNAAMVNYLAAVQELTRPEMLHPISAKTGKPLKPRPAPASALHKLVNRYLSDDAKGVIRDHRERYENWEEATRSEIETLVGHPPTFSLRHVPLEIAVPYACSDTDDTLGLHRLLAPRNDALADLDHRKIPMVAAMQERGLRIDMDARDRLLAELEDDLAGKLAVLRALTERDDFNPKSGDHIAEALFGIRKVAPGINAFLKDREYLLPTGWTKKGAPKTDKKALGTLKLDHELPGLLMEYKEVEKVFNTYVLPLPRYVKDGVMHPNFRHTRIPSGRLAAVYPNIMAIPTRSDLGRRVRELFLARDGYRFVNFDHSQIELRLAAEISNDEFMLGLFDAGVDLHTGTAAKISGRPISDTLFWESTAGKMFRALFKTINFGVLYGATAERVYFELLAAGIRTYSLDDCKKMVREWFELYAGVTAKIAETSDFLARHGYIEDMWGRRRTLPGGRLYGRYWPMSFLREEAGRQAFNMLIQGGAQGLLIRAMLGFWEEDMPAMAAMGHEVFAMLQVHDELIFEVPDNAEAVEVFKAYGLARMVADQDLFRVPIESSSGDALTWAGLK